MILTLLFVRRHDSVEQERSLNAELKRPLDETREHYLKGKGYEFVEMSVVVIKQDRCFSGATFEPFQETIERTVFE